MELGLALRTLIVAIAGVAVVADPALADHPVEGQLRGVHADYFDGGSSDTRWQLDTGEGVLRVLPTRIPALAPGEATVEVTGKEQDGSVVGSVSAASLQAAPALGARKLAVIVINFTTDTRQPWTPAEVRQRVFTDSNSTSAFFREESHNQFWLAGKAGNTDGDVYGWYTIDTPNNPCAYASWANAANTAATADGFSAGQYQHVMYLFPGQSSCGWAGLAYMPGTQSWINGDLSVRVTGHELGHNLGLHHAGTWDCTQGGVPVTLSSTCTVNEYNDRFDNMGAHGSRHSHGWHLQRLGVLQASNVQTITESGTYSMTSALEATAQPTTLRIPRTRSSGGTVLDWYYLEVRERGGVFDDFSLGDPVLGGVSVRVNDDPARTSISKLLDTHPASGGPLNAPLAPGETFSDGQVAVTTVSAGAGDATVAITLPSGPADTQAPSTPSGLGHTFTSAGAVRLAWNASSDNTAVSGYPVFRDGIQIAITGHTYYVDATAAAGPHVYTVYADDAASNRSAASAPHTVVVPSPPGVDTTSGFESHAGSGSDRSGPAIRLRRKGARNGRLLFVVRARDVSGVTGLHLLVDGRRLGGSDGARLRYRWRKSPGRHRVVVKAVDAEGNRSSLEVRLRVRRGPPVST